VPGIERQIILKHQDQEYDQGHEHIRRQHVQRIGLPVHRLAADPPPDQHVDEIVDRIDQGIQRGLPVSHHPGEIETHRDADHEPYQQRQYDLQPTLRCHGVPRGDQNFSGWITA
jgi:hypothetical protein